jgi:tetratricopeptide (TPR) repeat protein
MAPRADLSASALIGLCLIGSAVRVGAVQAQRRIPGETADSPSRLVTLGGWVQGDYGRSLPSGVTVRLETDEGMAAGAQDANAAGYFEFLGLAPAHYRLSVTASGFQPYEQELDLRSVGNRLNINIQLSPTNKSKALPPPEASSFTDTNAPKKARKEYQTGARALREGKLSEAQTHLEKSVDQYPCYARAQTGLAAVLAERRDLAPSEAALKKARACDPDYLEVYAALGQLYYDEKRYEASVAALQEGVRRSPGSWQFYYRLGSSEYGLRDYPKAEQAYLKAESLSSALPAEIHVKLADVYLKELGYEKAYKEMQAYVQAEPNGAFAAQIRSVMRRMESDGTVPPSSALGTQSPPAGP